MERQLEVWLIVGLTTITAGCWSPTPPLPPLLRNVSAGGGWWGACPAETVEDARLRQGMPLAISPELNQHLNQSFPPGTAELLLRERLNNWGFTELPPCPGDSSIHGAAFVQHGGNVFSAAMTANVFWKVDGAKNIVWTKGFVRYAGL
ncbi:MAG: hypothetical protein U1F35_00560 [Steroidobacteraceae bacterium]